MKLRDLLSEKKSQILNKWFDAIIEDYPADSSHFLKTQRDRFQNPVGNTISEGIQDIFEEFLQGSDSEKISPILNDIIKIKAVQDFTPSKALSFLFLLKNVIREEAGSEIRKKNLSDELAEFEANIDKLILLSFDIYMKCRERIYEIKADEVRRMTFRLLQRANLICEVHEEGSSPGEETVTTQKIKG